MSQLEDDGHPSSDFLAVEEEHEDGKQALWIGVRPIWYSDRRGEVMVQICYQEKHMAGPLAGPVWLTPDTWRELNRAVEWRLRRHETLRTRIRNRIGTRMKKILIIVVLAVGLVILSFLTGCGKTKAHPQNTPVPSYAVSSIANIPGFETPTPTPTKG